VVLASVICGRSVEMALYASAPQGFACACAQAAAAAEI
jgi:hypothetical protein